MLLLSWITYFATFPISNICREQYSNILWAFLTPYLLLILFTLVRIALCERWPHGYARREWVNSLPLSYSVYSRTNSTVWKITTRLRLAVTTKLFSDVPNVMFRPVTRALNSQIVGKFSFDVILPQLYYLTL